jgi:LysM domain
METSEKSPLRILAPIALVVFALAFVLVIAGSGGGGSGSESRGSSAAQQEKDLGTPASRREQRRERRRERRAHLPENVYVVQEGDTLDGIAEKTGVPVERLQELNPGLDQFQLTKGQRIKIR